ncbi:MAG: MoaD family protein [Chloroflexota bacterium]|nr:MoaD family protein [Chloroflexota bacterium]
MAVEVRVPSMLQKFTDGEKKVQLESANISELLTTLETSYPGIGDQLMEDGELRRFVNIYLNDEDIRFLDGMDTSLSDGDVLAILPALAGGSS